MANNRTRINELKKEITNAQNAIVEFLEKVPVEQTDEEKEEYKKKYSELRAIANLHKEELVKVRRNKTMSTAFEFIPSLPNRRQQRESRKLRRA